MNTLPYIIFSIPIGTALYQLAHWSVSRFESWMVRRAAEQKTQAERAYKSWELM